MIYFFEINKSFNVAIFDGSRIYYYRVEILVRCPAQAEIIFEIIYVQECYVILCYTKRYTSCVLHMKAINYLMLPYTERTHKFFNKGGTN